MMEELRIAKDNFEAAVADHDRNLKESIMKLESEEDSLKARLDGLARKKLKISKANGNEYAYDDDLIEINAGGRIIAARRSTLTQMKGTRMEALFSGRWEKKLRRDTDGRIFLDVNPVCFQAIVDYLSEMAVSSFDDPPRPLTSDDELKSIMQCQMDLFGLITTSWTMPESKILNAEDSICVHGWLDEDGSDGDLRLLYCSSRDGTTNESFHSKCDNRGCTLTIVKTTDGYVIGGYSNTSWTNPSSTVYHPSNKAFLFVLSGSDISCPRKMKLKNANDKNAVLHESSSGPTFGLATSDLYVKQTRGHMNFGKTYEPGPPGAAISNGQRYFEIKTMEVFEVLGESTVFAVPKPEKVQRDVGEVEKVTKFSESINQAINQRQEALMLAIEDTTNIENILKDESDFISAFVAGDVKDVVTLSANGTIMSTTRSTLQIIKDSVLAQQFDDSKWTEHGHRALRVEKWTPDQVSAWAQSIDNISDDIASIFTMNKIAGNELLALDKDGLMMLGITRTGTLCLLLKEIKKLEETSRDVVTLIEHSPYCFGKILDFLRLKHLHSQGLAKDPALPQVHFSQKKRFEKVVNYYFPGDSAKLILG